MVFEHRQPKLNIKEPLNYKDLYGNTTDLIKMVENNGVLSIKSTYPVFSCILCHLPAFQADSCDFGELASFGFPLLSVTKGRTLI